MIKLYCDECAKEILNKDYVEQSIFNHFDFEQSAEGIFCKECWEKLSPTSQTSPKGDFSNEKEHNMGDKVSASPTPTIPTESSHHPNIIRNYFQRLKGDKR